LEGVLVKKKGCSLTAEDVSNRCGVALGLQVASKKKTNKGGGVIDVCASALQAAGKLA
jgi:hypothetical protein